MKRPTEQDKPTPNKKQKSDTIPILRGRFKQRWLTKHSHLLKKSDDVTGLMVSCNVNAETRALGQVSTCLETYINILFPGHESTWTRFEGKLDIDEIDIEEPEVEKTDTTEKDGQENTEANDRKKEEVKEKVEEEVEEEIKEEVKEEVKEEFKQNEIERKEKKFQAIDAACGGLVFYRFRINVKPTEFVIKLMDYMKALPDKEREQELSKIRHCSRWIPLDYICPATTERIKACFERVRADYFENDQETTEDTVAIITENRNNIMITKAEIIQTIAPLIPPKYKINLSKPTYVILVTVFKSACGIAVLKNYYERKKYNLISYCQ